MDKHILDFKLLEDKFRSYLSDPTNRQVLFSGPFGSGKTTFLKTYFKKSKNTNVFRLFPVNYALHANTDIYEILKYDVILELIGMGAFQEVEIGKLTRYLYSTSSHLEKTVGKLIDTFSQTGKPIADAVKILLPAVKEIDRDAKKLSDPLLGIRAFMEATEGLQPYARQEYITSLIADKLAELKGTGKSRKKNILIVDDMDRIDPEHLFRIISIFSSHIDQDQGSNRFGFDKIIFVGDNENFRAIFSHRYGIASNYDAYISKLSSKQPFVFDPDKELYHQVEHLTQQILFEDPSQDALASINTGQRPDTIGYLTYIVSALLRVGSLTLREMDKYAGQHPLPPYELKKVTKLIGDEYDHGVYALFLLLDKFFPETREMCGAFDRAITAPLAVEKIMLNNHVTRTAAIGAFSRGPLSLLLPTQRMDSSNFGKTREFNIGADRYFVEVVHEHNMRLPEIMLTGASNAERELLTATLEAMLRLRELLKSI